MDVFDARKRSEIMSRIRSKDTKPERFVRKLLFSAGLRSRICPASLPGRPDAALARWRTAVFVNGCFWHSHPGCRFAAKPSQNGEYWTAKLRRNQERDREVREALLAMGWRVLIVWECACRKRCGEALLERMEAFIREGPDSERRLLEIGRADLEAGRGSATPREPGRN